MNVVFDTILQNNHFAGATARILAVALCLMTASGCAGTSDGSFPVNDGYTVSSRFEAALTQQPEYRWPTMTLRNGQRIELERRYKKIGNRELHLDLFLPVQSETNGKAIVLVHGGGWQSGNKSNFYPLANLLAQRGYVAIIPEFRLSPEAPYPSGLIDVRDAVDWTLDNAVQYGIDPTSIAIGGESSGGHMAALLAYTGGTKLFTSNGGAAPRVSALIDLDGVLDLTSPIALQYENSRGEHSPMALWLGGSWERAGQRWRQASPAEYIDRLSPPTLVISGGEERFTAGRQRVETALTGHGIYYRHINFEGLPHTFWLFEPHLTRVASEIDLFLKAAK